MDASVEQSNSSIVVNPDIKQFDLWLDKQLRGMFDAVAEEPVPQALIDLIKGTGEADS